MISIETNDVNISELVNTDVVAHISPSSLTEMQKIGEGNNDEYVHTL